MRDDEIARVCHEANRVLQELQADPQIPVSPPWDALDPESRLSIIEGVGLVRTGVTPAESHAHWCAFKERHGWVWGPVKSDVFKQHPNLVPYDELPDEQKLKDAVFVSIVRSLTDERPGRHASRTQQVIGAIQELDGRRPPTT